MTEVYSPCYITCNADEIHYIMAERCYSHEIYSRESRDEVINKAVTKIIVKNDHK